MRCLVANHVASWDFVLPQAEFAFNNFINRSTGCTPFEVVFGFRPHTPLNLHSLTLPARPSDEIASILDHQFVTTRRGGYYKFLVQWKNRPQSDSIWLATSFEAPPTSPRFICCLCSPKLAGVKFFREADN